MWKGLHAWRREHTLRFTNLGGKVRHADGMIACLELHNYRKTQDLRFISPTIL